MVGHQKRLGRSSSGKEMYSSRSFRKRETDDSQFEHVSMTPCPEFLKSIIEEVSLENLVYWKIQSLFDKFEKDPPKDVLKTVICHVERPLYTIILRKTLGNQSKASEILGCNRNTLRKKLKEFFNVEHPKQFTKLFRKLLS